MDATRRAHWPVRIGIVLEQLAAMTDVTPAATIVQWTFQFGDDRLTCSVEGSRSSYRVLVVPNGHADAAVVETFDSSAAALQHHAELAAALRDRGWAVISYTGRETVTPRRRYQPAA
jgi:hypothetical protein